MFSRLTLSLIQMQQERVLLAYATLPPNTLLT